MTEKEYMIDPEAELRGILSIKLTVLTSRQINDNLCEFFLNAIEFYPASMVGNYSMADAQSKTCADVHRFRREEWIGDFIQYVARYPFAPVMKGHPDRGRTFHIN
jgi:hypothetical protein